MQHDSGSLGMCDTGATGATADAAQNTMEFERRQANKAYLNKTNQGLADREILAEEIPGATYSNYPESDLLDEGNDNHSHDDVSLTDIKLATTEEKNTETEDTLKKNFLPEAKTWV